MKKKNIILIFSASLCLGMVAGIVTPVLTGEGSVITKADSDTTELTDFAIQNADFGGWGKAVRMTATPAFPDFSTWYATSVSFSYNKYLTKTDKYGATSDITEYFNYGDGIFWDYNNINQYGNIVTIPDDYYLNAVKDGTTYKYHVATGASFICKVADGQTGAWEKYIAPTALTLSETTATVEAGSTYTINPTVTTTDTSPLIFYKSSDETVATVSDAGVVTGVAAGSTTITVYSGGLTASLALTVTSPKVVSSINITTPNKELDIYQGNDWKIWLSKITAEKVYDDGTTSALTVTEDMISGTVNADVPGTYPLTLTYDGHTDTFNVVVSALPALDFTVDGVEAGADASDWNGGLAIVMPVEDEEQKYVNLKDAALTDVLAHIQYNGADFTSYVNGIKQLGGARYIIYTNSSFAPKAGDTITLKQGLKNYHYSGTSDGNHDPNGDGSFYAVRELKADYKIVCTNTPATPTAAVWAQWTADVTDFTISASKQNVSVGEALQLSAVLTPTGSYGSPAWTSSDETIATVDSTGLVTGVAEGNVTITATLGSIVKTIDLVVTPAKEVASVNLKGYDYYSVKVGSDASAFHPVVAKAQFVYVDNTTSAEFDITDSMSLTVDSFDTSKVAELSVGATLTIDGTAYHGTLPVHVYQEVDQKVKEVGIVDWFNYGMFIQCPATSTNKANLTDDETSAYYQGKIHYTRKDGTAVDIRNAYVLTTQIAIFPDFLYSAEGGWAATAENYNTLYQKGDQIVIDAGTEMRKWTGSIYHPGAESKPIAGTGEIISEGTFKEQLVYRYGDSGWTRYIATKTLEAKSDTLELEVGKNARCGIERGPEGANDGTLTFVSSDPTIAKVNEKTGIVSALKAGTCTITGTWVSDDDPNSKLTKTITVVVKEAPKTSEPATSEPTTPTSETPVTPSTNESSGLSGGAIAGIVIGSVAVVAAAVAIPVIVSKKKKAKK